MFLAFLSSQITTETEKIKKQNQQQQIIQFLLSINDSEGPPGQVHVSVKMPDDFPFDIADQSLLFFHRLSRDIPQPALPDLTAEPGDPVQAPVKDRRSDPREEERGVQESEPGDGNGFASLGKEQRREAARRQTDDRGTQDWNSRHRPNTEIRPTACDRRRSISASTCETNHRGSGRTRRRRRRRR